MSTTAAYDRATQARGIARARRKNPDSPVFAWLDAKGWSIDHLAVELGVKRAALGHYLRGRNAWPMSLAEKLHRLTGILPAQLGRVRP